MKLFGGAINFYGGIGKCNHKKFVKDTGFKTQKRIRTFTLQVATRYYEGMILRIAKNCFDARAESNNNFHELSEQGDKSAGRNYDFRGKYTLTFSGLEDMGIFTEYSVSNKKENPPLKCICGISVYAVTQFHQHGMITVSCYTSYNMTLENRNVTFCSNCNFGDDGEWYNWCLVEWIDDDEERNTYPGKTLGFFTMEGSLYAFLQSSSDPISMEQLTDEFICSFVIDNHQPTEGVEVEIISSTLCLRIMEVPRIHIFVHSPRGSGGIILDRK
jgi:hypothetical protein